MKAWYNGVRVCIRCREELKSHQRFRGNGVCCHCGHDSWSTVCDSTVEVHKTYRNDNPWWSIFVGKKLYTTEVV